MRYEVRVFVVVKVRMQENNNETTKLIDRNEKPQLWFLKSFSFFYSYTSRDYENSYLLFSRVKCLKNHLISFNCVHRLKKLLHTRSCNPSDW